MLLWKNVTTFLTLLSRWLICLSATAFLATRLRMCEKRHIFVPSPAAALMAFAMSCALSVVTEMVMLGLKLPLCHCTHQCINQITTCVAFKKGACL